MHFNDLKVGNYFLPSTNGLPGQVLTVGEKDKAIWKSLPDYAAWIQAIHEDIDMLRKALRFPRTYKGQSRFLNGNRTLVGGDFPRFPSFGHRNYTISAQIRWIGKPGKEPVFYQWVIAHKDDGSFNILTDKPVLVSMGEEYWLDWTVTEFIERS